jgi:CRP/FNR family transcriptional regulator, cyclic AMP receptor protein
MLKRFLGDEGRRLRIDAIVAQKIVAGNRALAEELADRVELLSLTAGETLIEQATDGNEIYLILSGTFDIVVNGRVIGKPGTNDHLGEMAAVQPTQKRAASAIAIEDAVVAKLPEPDFYDLASRHPEMYRHIAKELAIRLLRRNALIGAFREKVRVFIISSVEALPIARLIQEALEHDPFTIVIWTNGVFRATHYTLQDIEEQVDRSDFAVAIAHSDDLTESRGKDWPSPRDNVIFELGLFMGRLGRARAILMEPRDEKVKLPSDLSGVTTIPYRYEKGTDAAALIGPACNKLREYIFALGPNN